MFYVKCFLSKLNVFSSQAETIYSSAVVLLDYVPKSLLSLAKLMVLLPFWKINICICIHIYIKYFCLNCSSCQPVRAETKYWDPAAFLSHSLTVKLNQVEMWKVKSKRWEYKTGLSCSSYSLLRESTCIHSDILVYPVLCVCLGASLCTAA